MNGWQEYELEDVVEKFIDYRGKTPEKTLAGIPLITAKIVKNGRIESPNEFISQDNYTKWMRRGYPEINDVVMTTEAPLGEVALLKDKNVALAQRVIVIRGRGSLCDNTFLKYYLQSPFGQEELLGRASGTTVEGIKASELRRIVVSLPPLPEQRAIAGVLSSLDDKIDLLHRQNKTLEGIASTLWRKMFVEEVRSDWETMTIGDVVTTNGKSIGKDYPYREIEYLDTGSITEGRIAKLQHLSLQDAPSRARRIVQENDIVISMVRPIQKHYGILKKVDNNTVVSTGFVVITCRAIDPHFLYLLLTQHDMTEYLEIVAEGSTTTYPSLVPSDIEKIEFQMPPAGLMQQFSGCASNIWNKIYGNHEHIRTLSRLRDTLLPKLMSGEVRVRL